MRVLHWRLLLAVLWLVVALALFFRDELLPADLLARYQGRNLTLWAWFWLLLAGWNAARWYQRESVRRQRALAARERPRPREPAGYEYNPEFDFQKMEREGKDAP